MLPNFPSKAHCPTTALWRLLEDGHFLRQVPFPQTTHCKDTNGAFKLEGVSPHFVDTSWKMELSNGIFPAMIRYKMMPGIIEIMERILMREESES